MLALDAIAVQDAPVAVHGAAPVAELPFTLVNDHVLLHAEVDGVPAELILDTGSATSVLDSAWAAEKGVAQNGQPVQALGTGTARLSMSTVGSLRVGPLELHDLRMGVVPLTGVMQASGHRVQGTLGLELFARWVVEVDYAAERVRVYEPRTFDYRGAGEQVPVSLDNPIPVALVDLELRDGSTARARLAVDLGSSRLSVRVSRRFAQEHRGLAGGLHAPMGTGVGGMIMGFMHRIPALRIGGLRVAGPTVAVAEEDRGFLTVPWADGTLGAPVFRGTRMFIDYARRRIIFEPTPALQVPAGYDASGLYLVAEGEELRRPRVRHVAAGSPAAAAGVRQGDELVSIDGRPAAGMELEAIRALLRRPGETRRLILRRDGQTLDVLLPLRELL
ncbi:MAG TPA: aspartyl protease family protein [Longimicrobium sp.]|nr:aspartyl protease family protein [Longimicrobium sp.]